MPSHSNPFHAFGTALRMTKKDQFHQRWRRRVSLAAAGVCAPCFVALVLLIALIGGSVPQAWAQTSPSPIEAPEASTLGTLPQALRSPPPTNGGMIGLRRHVVVRADVVRLGDLFEGSVPNPDKPLFRAPAPGETVQLDVGYLSRLAQAEGIDWHPLSQSDSATVSRASNRISTEELLAPLITALAPMGLQPTADIEFTPQPPPLAVAAGTIPEITISSPRYDRASGRFAATVTINADGSPPIEIPISGVAYETLDIPVAATTTNRNQVIEPKDVVWQRVRSRTLAPGVATEYDQVIGYETRRVLRPGDPFRLHDLHKPLLVKKGNLVTMILATPMMQLTAQGKALEDGALGDVIKVENPRSGKTILGTVVENRTVTVESSDAMPLQ